MAKKKFSQGLDDLFSELPAERAGLALTELTVPPPPKKATIKTFAEGIDALLQEAFEQSVHPQEAPSDDPIGLGSGKTKSALANTAREGMSGLDALIRETVSVQEYQADEATAKRRLVVSVDYAKFEQLQTIARSNNTYLKNLLTNLIDEFLQNQHERGAS